MLIYIPVLCFLVLLLALYFLLLVFALLYTRSLILSSTIKQKESILDTKTIRITACASSNMNGQVTDTGLRPIDA